MCKLLRLVIDVKSINGNHRLLLVSALSLIYSSVEVMIRRTGCVEKFVNNMDHRISNRSLEGHKAHLHAISSICYLSF